MKNIFKLLFVSLLAALLWSCEKDEDRAIVSDPTTSSLTSDKTSLILTKETSTEDVINFAFVSPNYGANVPITNELEFAKAGTNFVGAKSVILESNAKTITYKGQAFNALMLNVGLAFNKASDIEVRLKSTVGVLVPVYSTAIKLNITPYALISYLYAPGAYQGWAPATANTLTSSTSNGEYEGYIDFRDVNDLEFKITADRSGDNGYGTDDGAHLILNGGANLKAKTLGSQKITVNLNDKTFKLTPYSWGIIGSASPGGWDTDTNMFWNDLTQSFEIENVALTVGEIKFRLNGSWDVNYGGANGNAEAGGNDIKVDVAGNYKISFDLVNLKYKLTKL